MTGAPRSRWAPPAAWAALMLLGTSWPSPGVPQVGHADKLVHAFFYGVLAWLVGRAAPSVAAAPARFAAALAGLVAFGALDEWHQGFIPGRSASAGDLLADSIGAVVGLLLLTIRRRRAVAAA